MIVSRRAALVMAAGGIASCARAAQPRVVRLEDAMTAAERAALARGDARLDCTRALRAALAGLGGGGTLALPAGTLPLDAAALAEEGLPLAANVVVRGAGSTQTRLEVRGGRTTRLFVARDASDIAIEGVALVGNGRSTGEGVGGALFFVRTSGGPKRLAGPRLSDVALDNFAAPGWVQISNLGPDGIIAGVAIDGFSAVSRSGNALAPRDIRQNSAALLIDAFHGPIEDVRLRRLHVAAAHIKSGVILYHRIRRARLEDVTVIDAGRYGAGNDAGAYAIQLYDATSTMSDIAVVRPRLVNPRSCGIYATGVEALTIVDPVISGQRDPLGGTLPKAAIALSVVYGARVTGGALSDNRIDIAIVPGDLPKPLAVTIEGVRMTGSSVAAILATVRDDGPRAFGPIAIRDCTINAGGRGIVVRNSRARHFRDVSISGSTVSAGDYAIDLFADTTSAAPGYAITGTRITARHTAIRARAFPGALALADVALSVPANGVALDVRQIGGLTLDRVTIAGVRAPLAGVADTPVRRIGAAPLTLR